LPELEALPASTSDAHVVSLACEAQESRLDKFGAQVESLQHALTASWH
jgi:hypothetical protein